MNNFNYELFNTSSLINHIEIDNSNFNYSLLENFNDLDFLVIKNIQLKTLPASFRSLKKMDALVIENCGLEALNEDVLVMKDLRVTSLVGNGVIQNLELLGEFDHLLKACTDYIPGNIEALQKIKEQKPELLVTPEECEEI